MFREAFKRILDQWNEEPTKLFYLLPIKYQKDFLFGTDEEVQKAIDEIKTRERFSGKIFLTEDVLSDIEEFRWSTRQKDPKV